MKRIIDMRTGRETQLPLTRDEIDAFAAEAAKIPAQRIDRLQIVIDELAVKPDASAEIRALAAKKGR